MEAQPARPTWQSVAIVVVRLFMATWFFLFGWLAGLTQMATDSCPADCSEFERQLNTGWVVTIGVLAVLFVVSFLIELRVSSFGKKVAVWSGAWLASLLVVFGIGGYVTSLSP